MAEIYSEDIYIDQNGVEWFSINGYTDYPLDQWTKEEAREDFLKSDTGTKAPLPVREERDLTVLIHNDGTMEIMRNNPDERITVFKFHRTNDRSDTLHDVTISSGDMIKLVNLYCYIKNNGVQNDFLDLGGKNK